MFFKLYFRGVQFEKCVEEMDVLSAVFLSHPQFLQTHGATVVLLTQALPTFSSVVCTSKAGCLNRFPQFQAANMKNQSLSKISEPLFITFALTASSHVNKLPSSSRSFKQLFYKYLFYQISGRASRLSYSNRNFCTHTLPYTLV